MSARAPLSTVERARRARRAREAYRRLHLYRRSWGRRFYDSLSVIPFVFLRRGAVAAARLLAPADQVRAALRGRAVWTLDTAARLDLGIGLLRTGDLTGYLMPGALDELARQGLVDERCESRITLDPLLAREPQLVAHAVDELPPHTVLASGDLVVTRDRLRRDLMGTLGWRPDLFVRLEAAEERRRRSE